MPKSLPKPLRKQREVLYLPVAGHSAVLGTAGSGKTTLALYRAAYLSAADMHNQVCQWAKQPYLNTLLDLLLDRGFRVYLTSDHGNLEAEGCGRPSEGAVADLRGERVRIYPDAALRGKVKERFPDALEWGTVGLPEDYLALLAPARRAFVQEKQRAVSHGGVSVEELIVPLIQIERRGE